ncbi:MAG: ABC transporter substrate-binding protein [Chloroflexi bacterium]|nr:ABC transporter substrate-binding protein [Chloroflexota bacterium]
MFRADRLMGPVSTMIVLGLLLASCAPPAAPAPTSAPAPKAPAAAPKAETPAPKAPAATGAPSPTPKPAGDQPRYGGILTILTDVDPPSFDAHQESAYWTFHPVGPATSTLLQFDPLETTKAIPDLAERWEASADGLTYTFYLRKGAKFHNGMPATAEDARYSLERVRTPPRGMVSPRRQNLQPLKSMEAVDETTLKVTLERVYPSFVPFIAQGWMAVYPKKVIEEKGDMKRDVVGTGPFKYKEYRRGVSHDLVKFDDYFIKGRPYLDGVKYYIVREAATRLAALRTKKALVILPHPGITPPEAEVIKKEETNMVTQSGLYLTHDNLVMNTSRKPWDDVRVRRAVLLATDKQAAVQFVRQGGATVGGPMPPSGLWDIPKDELLKMPGFRQPKDQDIAEAKKLLAEAGVAPGTRVGLMTRQTFSDLAIFMQSQLTGLGFNAVVDIQEPSVATDRQRKRDFDVNPGGLGIAVDDPDAFFGELYTSNAPRNFSGLKDPKVDELFEKQTRTLDLVARKQIVIDMQKLALENPGVVPIAWRLMTMAQWKEVMNYKMPMSTFNNTKFQDVWLAK